MEITKGHHYQALASWHLFLLGFDRGKGPVFMYENVDASRFTQSWQQM